MHRVNSVLITGANRGIGLEFARQYTQAGWRVYATCLNPRRAHDLNQLAAQGSELVSVHQLDVTNKVHREAIKDMLTGVALDILINNAGVLGAKFQEFGHSEESAWLHAMHVNAIAPIKMIEVLVDNIAMSERRLVVNITSRMGSMAENQTGGYYLYRSSKAALNALVHNVAIDLMPKGIKVIALHPGWVRTDMGGIGAEIEVTHSVASMMTVLDNLGIDDSGGFFDLNGATIPW